MAREGELATIVVREDKLDVTTNEGDIFRSRKESSVSVLELLEQEDIETGPGGVQIEVKKSGGSFFGILLTFLPIIIFGGLIFYMLRGARGGINQALSIGKPESTERGRRVSVLKRQEGAPVLLG